MEIFQIDFFEEAISNRKQPQSVSNSPSQSSSRPTRQSKITVAVRKRPLSSKEAQNGPDVIEIPPGQQQVHLGVSRTKLDGLSRYTETFSFAFDRVYDQSATNQLVLSNVYKYSIVDRFMQTLCGLWSGLHVMVAALHALPSNHSML